MLISSRDVVKYQVVARGEDGAAQKKSRMCSGFLIDRLRGVVVGLVIGDRAVSAGDVIVESDGKLLVSPSPSTASRDAHVELVGLPVLTWGDERIGTVMEFVVDLTSWDIVQYRVKPEFSRRIAELLRHPARLSLDEIRATKELLIGRTAVIEIRTDALVIRDGSVEEGAHVQLVERARAVGDAPALGF